MFKLKELLDGVIEDILELPAMWVRTHFHAFAYGRLAPFVIARRLNYGDKRYLRLRTAAFIDLLIVYALLQASNETKGAFGNSFLAVLLQPQNINLGDSSFIGLLIAFFTFYYAYYVIIARMPIAAEKARVLSGACLFYAVLCLGFLFAVFLLLFGSGGGWVKEFILRGSICAFDASVSWLVGSAFAWSLHLTGRQRWLGTAAFSLGFFGLYALVVTICFGGELLWPNLRV